MHESKKTLRARLLADRSAMLPAGRDAAARCFRDALLTLPEAEMAGTVAAYASIGTEPGTSSLLYALWKRGTYVLLPRLLPDRDLDWASYEGPGSLVPGPHGLLEPSEPPRGPDAIRGADIVITPALAVDADGMRLGKGGGCYDRALARLGAGTLTIALVYDEEYVGTLPAEPHDQRVRAVVTPSRGVVRLPGPPRSDLGE